MQTEFYKKYMKSARWKTREFERMALDDFKCVMCGRPEEKTRGLQVHHITYIRLGNENIYTDLATLCGRCHRYIHNYNSRITERGRNE